MQALKCPHLFQFDSKVHYELRMVIYDLAKSYFNHTPDVTEDCWFWGYVYNRS